ncbi:MAG TPA: hypothetical protein VFL57_12790 [Bryobacteraceae bacterium]|nr:hypothetical protein [Bryobacteraceae bacterium]
MFRVPALLVIAVCLAFGQVRMSPEQLRAFIESSRKLGHSDRKVADYVKTIRLSHRLDDSAIEDLQAAGAGPRTLEALRVLAAVSRDLPAAPAAPPRETPKPIPAPDDAEQKRAIEDARQYAIDYVKNLPNFICTQVTRRYVDESGLEFYRLVDTVIAKLSYDGRREDYRVMLVNNRVVDTTMERIGGTTSTGEFGSMMRDIFDPDSQARFSWERWGTLRGRRMHVFRYAVDRERSRWHIRYERTHETVPAYRGLIYVDRDMGSIMRMTLEAFDLPAMFPVQHASTVLDYDFAEIGGRQYIVPLKARVQMRAGKYLTRNDVEFRFYKRFGAEATIQVDVLQPLPEDLTKEDQPKK